MIAHNNKFGEILRKKRIAAGYPTQVSLAKKIGVCRSCVNRYERGSVIPSLRRVLQLRDALGIQFTDFNTEN